MIEEAIEIRTADGTADGILFRDEGGRRMPGVIHLTDIGGIRPSHREMARRLATTGYTVLLPNVFYRTGRPPMFDFTPTMGEERTMKRFGELAGALNADAMNRDAGYYVDFLAGLPSVSAGSLGVVGYCFTGAMAMRTAAERPAKIAAAASFHGGSLFTDTASSPHHVLARVKARLYFGHAIQDRSMPADAIEKLDRALAAWGGKFESEVYDAAYHGWTTPDAAVYNQPQAERAFEKLTALFAATLK
ncbi:MAG TPA: dienelactone hydrolase family protein [Candidatus Binataceae bacterium]|nr:dienelactone hydrolase family protein [Candidatus Binataceae bacterium]